MRNIILVFSAAILTGFILITVSCSPGACFDETNAYLKASLYLSNTDKLTAPDSLTLYGIGRDTSKIYNAMTSLTKALLPLNSSVGNCSFVIRINGVYDTLSAWYTTYPHLISEECGYAFYHTLDSLQFTHNNIDKITIIKNTVTTLNEENIRIYY